MTVSQLSLLPFKQVNKVAFHFQFSASTANLEIAALLVEVERSPELSYLVMQIVQKLYRIVMKIPALVSAE